MTTETETQTQTAKTARERALVCQTAGAYTDRLNAEAKEAGRKCQLAPPYPDEVTGLDVAWRLASNAYSDLCKDLYGYRPRGSRGFDSLDALEAEVDRLGRELEAEVDRLERELEAGLRILPRILDRLEGLRSQSGRSSRASRAETGAEGGGGGLEAERGREGGTR